jgi:FkbM family methyltransferase
MSPGRSAVWKIVKRLVPPSIGSAGRRVLDRLRYVLFRDTTQAGEFFVLNRLLHGVPRSLVDVGANDGKSISNSYPFIKRGWDAVCIEPHPVAFAKLERLHRGNEKVKCLNIGCSNVRGILPLHIGSDGELGSLSTFSKDQNEWFDLHRTSETLQVNVERLSEALKALNWPQNFGLLSLDTEGLDLMVLEGLDLQLHSPAVIITEVYAPTEEPKAKFLEAHGYKLVATVGCNTIWKKAARPCSRGNFQLR